MTVHKFFLALIALLFAVFPFETIAGGIELKPNRVQLHYSGHLMFIGDEFAAEGEWLFHKNDSGWFPELGVATGLGFLLEFDFFEIPIDARANFYKFKIKDGFLGMGLGVTNGFGFTSSSANLLPLRICVFSPIGYDRWSVHIDYCTPVVGSSLRAGLGVAYEL